MSKYGEVVKNVIYEGKFVQVSEAWLNSLIRDYNEMCALRDAGVDNWEGYSEAVKIWKQRNPEDWKDENR